MSSRLRLTFRLSAWFISGATLLSAELPITLPSPPAPPPPAAYVLRVWREQDGLPSDDLSRVLQGPSGYLWVAAQNELVRFDGTRFDAVDFPAGAAPSVALRRTSAPVARSTSEVELSLAGLGDPAARQAETAGTYHLIEGTWHFEANDGVPDDPPTTLFDDAGGGQWLGWEDGTVWHRTPQGEARLHRPFASPSAPLRESDSPPPGDATPENRFPRSGRSRHDRVPTFATDARGRLWITHLNRLAHWDGGQFTEHRLDASANVVRIISSPTGGLWAVTPTQVLRHTGSRFAPVAELPRLLGAHYLQVGYEDRHGHLWLGTRSQGLHRIIGAERLAVPTSSEDITDIAEDRHGNLWVTTNGGGLNRLRPRVHQLYDRAAGLIDKFSYTVAEDAAGAVWLANRDGGMARITGGKVDLIARFADGRTYSARSVYPDANGRVWVTTGLGIFTLDPAHPAEVHPEPALAAYRNVRASFVASNGDYWFTDDQTVVRWRNGETTAFSAAQGLDAQSVRAFAEGPDGRLWVGADQGALFRSTANGFERVAFPGAEQCGPLQTIRFTAEGHLLIGTTRYGLLLLPHGNPASPRLLTTMQGLANNNISQVLRDDHDRFWFAARRGLFWVAAEQINAYAESRIEYVHSVTLGRDDGLPFLSCLGLYQPAAWKSRDGTLWFATRSGVVHIDPAQVGHTAPAPAPVSATAVSFDNTPAPLRPVYRLSTTTRRLQFRLSALELTSPDNVNVRYRLEGFDNNWSTLGSDRTVTYPGLPAGTYTLLAMSGNASGEWSPPEPLARLEVAAPWWLSPAAHLAYATLGLVLFGLAVRAWSLRRLRRRLEQSEREHAIERERARIARNIHDDIGATLTRISLLTQTARQQSDAPDPTLEAIHGAARALIRSMDEIVWAADPRHDTAESLACFIANYAPAYLAAAGVRCRLQIADTLPELPLTSQLRYNLFLACKEALNNIVKHAGATEVVVAIDYVAPVLHLTLTDNGCGLPSATATPPSPVPDRAASGQGLRNLADRLTEIGGSARIGPAPDGGTRVALAVELHPPPS